MSTVSVLFKLCLYRSDLSSDNLNESFLVALVLSCVVFFQCCAGPWLPQVRKLSEKNNSSGS